MTSTDKPSVPSRVLNPTLRVERRGRSRWVPGLRMLWYYKPSWFRHDLLAGFVLTAILVPVGIAYAEASGVPGIYGL